MQAVDWRQIAVHHDFREIGAEYIGAGFDQNRNQRHRHLPFVGTQVGEQPFHQPAVIRFA